VGVVGEREGAEAYPFTRRGPILDPKAEKRQAEEKIKAVEE
jgi:hypothetical protein